MKITVENLGVLKNASYELGDMTVICGANGTGKTYAVYSLYGFLKYWSAMPVRLKGFLSNDLIDELFENGNIKIMLDEMCDKVHNLFNKTCRDYCNEMPVIFGAPDDSFIKAKFNVDLTKISENYRTREMNVKNDLWRGHKTILRKKANDDYLTVTFEEYGDTPDKIGKQVINGRICSHIIKILSDDALARPFIASIERTGAATFQKGLDINITQILDSKTSNIGDISELADSRRYALPVKDDINFIRRLDDIIKHTGYVSKNHPDIIDSFRELLSGDYGVSNGSLYFNPNKSKAKLTMNESASSVRSLINLGIYLQHIAEKGDILIIDEPELNLHPQNQRQIARVLAKMVNAGIKIIITTHSDYIVKEISSLIMLRNLMLTRQPFATQMLEKYKYCENELLDYNNIKVYVAKESVLETKGSTKKQRYNTLVPVQISKEGIELEEFDETINIMNEIQDELLYGGHYSND